MGYGAHSLWNNTGQRLYLTPKERLHFLKTAQSFPPEWRTFAELLALTGCRISEALALKPINFDFSDNRVAVETLKQRRTGVWRRVPLPVSFLIELEAVHDLRRLQANSRTQERIWPACRTTAYEKMKEIMRAANIHGAHANPKGLRHAFAINAVLCEVPITAIQKWMGHARLETTQVYLNVAGNEEYELAERMWK